MISLTAQTTLTGKITDQRTGEELISASVVISQKGNFIQGDVTDFDGNYSIRVDPGVYNVEISYTGFRTQKITGIVAKEGMATKVDVQLISGPVIVQTFYCGCCFAPPLINHDKTTQGVKLDSYKIGKTPTRDIKEMSTFAPGVSFNQ